MKSIIHLLFLLLLWGLPAPAAQSLINIGTTPNDDSGDQLRSAFNKINLNITELYSRAFSSNITLWSAIAPGTGVGTALALAPNAAGGFLTTLTGDITNTGGVTSIASGAILNADINTAAGITLSKLGQSSATTNQVPTWNGTAWVPASVATSTEVTAIANDLAALTLDAVSVVGEQTITGNKYFVNYPSTAVVPLAGGTTLTIGRPHQDGINTDRTVTFSGTPWNGAEVSLRLYVTGSPTLTFPNSKRAGELNTAVNQILLWPGLHTLSWVYLDDDGAGPNGEWWAYDSIYARVNVTTVDPLPTNAKNQGYGPGSTWTNTTDDGIFICSDATVGAAVWKEVGGAGGAGLTAETFSYTIQTGTLTTGTSKLAIHAPYNMTITGLAAGLGTVSSSGLPTFDLNTGAGTGTSILSTKLTVNANAETSYAATTPHVFTSANVAKGTRMTVDIDTAGTGAADGRLYMTVIPWDGIVAGPADYTTNMIARVGFEEGSGTAFADTVGTLGTGTGNAASVLVAGKVGSWALQMDALEAVNFGDTAIFDDRTAMTLSYWWRRDAAGSGSDTYLLRKLTNSGNLTLTSYLLNSTTPKIEVRTNTVPATATSQSATAITNTAWHHTALVYTGTEIELWIDGVKVDNDPQSGTAYNSSGTFWIGPITSGSATVSIDDFRLYSTALGSTEIATIISAANP